MKTQKQNQGNEHEKERTSDDKSPAFALDGGSVRQEAFTRLPDAEREPDAH